MAGVVVTGGASGIGKACAELLSSAGRPVAVWDRVTADLPGVESVRVDVTNSAALPAAVAATRAAIGPVDGVVHAAGTIGPAALDDLADVLWDKVVDLNLRAPAMVTRALLGELRSHSAAAVVCVSSITALVGKAGAVAYCASKAGILGLARSLAQELAPIRVNAVCPGYIDTPMLVRSAAADPGLPRAWAAKSVLGRLGTGAEVAAAVAFLLGSGASFVTGAYLVVDGGASAVDG